MLLKNGGNKNSPDPLNVMVNYHYHSEKRFITRYFPFMDMGFELAFPVVTVLE